LGLLEFDFVQKVQVTLCLDKKSGGFLEGFLDIVLDFKDLLAFLYDKSAQLAVFFLKSLLSDDVLC
jgi:hypothetical protein